MSGQELIDLYTFFRGVFITLTVIGFLAAVVLYFAVDIKTIFLINSGLAERQRIRERNELNEQTKRLNPAYSFSGVTSDTSRAQILDKRRNKKKKMSDLETLPIKPQVPTIETTLLEENIKNGNPVQPRQYYSTTVLSEPAMAVPGFSVVEDTVVIHTNEIIP